MTDAEVKMLREQGPFTSGVLPTRPANGISVVESGPCAWCGELWKCTPKCMALKARFTDLMADIVCYIAECVVGQQSHQREEKD